MRPANKNDPYRFRRERPRLGERVFIHPATCLLVTHESARLCEKQLGHRACNAARYVRLKDRYLKERG